MDVSLRCNRIHRKHGSLYGCLDERHTVGRIKISWRLLRKSHIVKCHILVNTAYTSLYQIERLQNQNTD